MCNSIVCSTFNVKCSWDGLHEGRNCSCIWSFWFSGVHIWEVAAFLSCSDTKENQGCWFPGLNFLPEHYVTVSIVLLLWDSHGCERDTMTLHFVCVSAMFEWHLAKYLFPKKIFPSFKAGLCAVFPALQWWIIHALIHTGTRHVPSHILPWANINQVMSSPCNSRDVIE